MHTTTTTQFDPAGRVSSISYDDGITPTKSFAYDTSAGWTGPTYANLIGRLSNASISISGTLSSETIYNYDAMGRIVDMGECLPSGCSGGSPTHRFLHYTYDLAGNLASSTDGAGVQSTYLVSRANEISSLTISPYSSSNPHNVLSVNQNGPNGPVSWNLGNGLSGVYGYDSLGRLNAGWVCLGSSLPYCSGGAQRYGFVVGWLGTEATSACDTVQNQCSTFGYDEFNRLTARTVTSGTTQNFSWAYDRWGNRLNQTVTAGSGPAPITSFNTANNQVTTTGYGYDAAGNMINDPHHSYTYDPEGNITKVDSGTTAQYTLDALNHRVKTTVGTTTKEFVFNAAGQRVSIWNGTTHSQISGQYYWGGVPIAYYDTYTHFQHQDWLGTERLRTKNDASTEGTFTSLPFGDALTQTTTSGTDTDAYHSAGLDHDSESGNTLSGTDHAQFRQYSDTLGLWMSPDPYAGSYDFTNPQSLNRYAYVGNNPLSATDVSGLMMCFDFSCEGTDPGDTNCLPDDPYCEGCDPVAFNCGGDPGIPGGWDGPISSPQPEFKGYENLDPNGVMNEHLGLPPGMRLPTGDLAMMAQVIFGLPTLANVGCLPICDANGTNNSTSWYQNTCITSALLKGAESTALDSIGLLAPAGLARWVGHQSGFRGIVADNVGKNLLSSVSGTSSSLSLAVNLKNSFSTPEDSLYTVASVMSFIPVPGMSQATSIVMMGVDVYKTVQQVRNCR